MSKYTAPDEVVELPGHCLACNADAVTRVFQTSIPYFKVLDHPFLLPYFSDTLRPCALTVPNTDTAPEKAFHVSFVMNAIPWLHQAPRNPCMSNSTHSYVVTKVQVHKQLCIRQLGSLCCLCSRYHCMQSSQMLSCGTLGMPESTHCRHGQLHVYYVQLVAACDGKTPLFKRVE